jgi:hypothetical protein
MHDKVKKQADTIVLNVDCYKGDVDELIEVIMRKIGSNGDLKHLQNLFIIQGGKIIYIWGRLVDGL